MINDVCLKTLNWRGKENIYSVSRTRRIIVVDELLFMLLWSSGCIGFKNGLSLSGTFSLLFFCFVIVVLFVGAHVSLQSEWHWPDQRSLLIGFLGIFFGLVLFSKRLYLASARGQWR
jgi:hypothetical protein